MLITLGGASRSGKGIIAGELVRKTAIPLLSLDVLKMGLHHAVPSVGVDPSAPSGEVGEKMWPLVSNCVRTQALKRGWGPRIRRLEP